MAYLIDGIILGLIALVLFIPTIVLMFLPIFRQQQPSPLAPFVMMASYAAVFVVQFAYHVYFVGAKGATPGKKIMKLKVMMQDGLFPIGYGKAFMRALGLLVSGMICGIGFLLIAFDKEQHRGLHDKMAGTVVVKES